jgi:hypothetical protein
VIDRIPGKVILLVFTCLLALRLGIWIYKRFQVPRLRRTILTCLGSFTFIALSTVIVPAALAEVHLSATEFSMKFSDFNVAAALTACAFGALMFACLVLHFEVSKFEQEKNCTL